MRRLHSYPFLTRLLILMIAMSGTWIQTGHYALADYVPPGGEPPPGRTSTSGMEM